MQTAALDLARQTQGAPELFSYGAIELQVTNPDRATTFWTDNLGLVVRDQHDGVALGTQQQTLVVLRAGAQIPAQGGHTGLYHVAIGVPDQGEFSRLLTRLLYRRVRISLVDHLMSKAIYLQDPDGIGIEIAFETPERFGRFGTSTNKFELFDAYGNPHSAREPLHAGHELSLRKGDIDRPIADGATIAHLHFTVADLQAAIEFYAGLGFAPNLHLPQMGFADLGAGGSYTHRIALNTWQGTDIPPAPTKSARLTGYTLRAVEPRLVAQAATLSGADILPDGIQMIDPSGTSFTIVTAP
mgnify:FL=1